jgi:hypothetical protein
MLIKRIAIGVAALTLPFALAATPASAADRDDHREGNDPEISIGHVEYDHGDLEVTVKYDCDGRNADIEVEASQHGDDWSDDKRVNCRNDRAYFKLDDVDLRRGQLKVKATIEDRYGDDTAYKYFTVRVHH